MARTSKTLEQCYSILELENGASEEEIKKAYRRLAVKYHPDKNQDDPTVAEKFNEITEAYDILTSKEKRQKAASSQFGFNDDDFKFAKGFEDKLKEEFPDLYSDVFSNYFKKKRNSNSSSVLIKLDLTKFANGTSDYKLSYSRMELCKCYTKAKYCPSCQGSGKKETTVNSILGRVKTKEECKECSGTGKTESCKECENFLVLKDKEKSIDIDPYFMRPNTLLLKDGGNYSFLTHSYLSLKLTVELLKPFTVIGKEGNLSIETPLSYLQLLRGCKMELDTHQGIALVEIPPRAEIGKPIIINNFGLKDDSYLEVIPTLYYTNSATDLSMETLDSEVFKYPTNLFKIIQ